MSIKEILVQQYWTEGLHPRPLELSITGRQDEAPMIEQLLPLLQDAALTDMMGTKLGGNWKQDRRNSGKNVA